MNSTNRKGKSGTQPTQRKTVSISKTMIFVGIALVVGFIGGILFADNANKQMQAVNSMQMMANNPAMGNMQSMDVSMGRGMAPGPVNMDTQQAIVKMESMLKSDPNNVQLMTHLGNLYFDTHNPQKAVETYEKVLEIEPNNPNVLTDCGIMYRQLKKPDKALAYFKKANKLDPSHFQSAYNMGIVYREDLKQYQKAIDVWNKLLTQKLTPAQTAQVRTDIQNTKALM